MAQRAQVSSVQAIGEFRAKLFVFMSKARAALEEVSDEIRRTRAWLENERRPHWEKELRRRNRELDEREQELLSAKLSRIRTQSAAQALAVERAKRAVREAEEKRLLINKWVREFENRAEPLGKQVEQLLTFVGTDLAKAGAHLGSVITALETYAAVASEVRTAVATEGSAPEAASTSELRSTRSKEPGSPSDPSEAGLEDGQE